MLMLHSYRIFLITWLFSLPFLAYGQQTLYVKADAAGANDGSSWTDAFTDLQDALAAAVSGDVVWVAAGTYQPHVPPDPTAITVADRSVSFDLKPGVGLFGGFAGDETRLDQRDLAANRTILSGDLLDNDNEVLSIHEPTRADNSYHVVRARELRGMPALMDGFTVTGGNANPPPLNNDNSGGGMEIRDANPVVRNTLFIANTAQYGGGASVIAFGAPLLQHVSFHGNAASRLSDCSGDSGCAGDGGGLFSGLSSLALEHVTFIGNVAENDGGGMYSWESAPVITYATFDHNRAQRGGGLLNRSSPHEHKVVNAAFFGNEAALAGGGMYNDDANPVLINVVFSGNRSTNPDNRGGGGLYNITLTSERIHPFLWNVTFSGNHSESDGGAIFNHNSDMTLIHAILWGNKAANGVKEIGRFDSRGTTRIGSSLIEGGLPDWTQDQGGNLDADPLFINPAGDDGLVGTEDDNLHLLPASPAIDAGRNDLLPPDLQDLDLDGNTQEDFPVDLEGRIRAFNGGSGSPIVDMGAYEYGAPFAIPTAVEPEPEEIPDNPAVVSSFPNPFRNRVTLRFEVATAGPVVLRIYDLIGKTLATLVDEVKPPGTYEATFDAPDLPSGVYLYRLETAERHATGKMLHVR